MSVLVQVAVVSEPISAQIYETIAFMPQGVNRFVGAEELQKDHRRGSSKTGFLHEGWNKHDFKDTASKMNQYWVCFETVIVCIKCPSVLYEYASIFAYHAIMPLVGSNVKAYTTGQNVCDIYCHRQPRNDEIAGIIICLSAESTWLVKLHRCW